MSPTKRGRFTARSLALFAMALIAPACGRTQAAPSESSPRPRVIVATPANESSPATNGTDVAWTRGSFAGPVIVMDFGSVFVRHGDSKPVQISPRGMLAASGGMDTRTLVVQVIRNRQSDLLLFDLQTRRFHEPPRGVNTRAWEWRGSISGRSLLFGRFDGVNRYDIVLTDLQTGHKRVLDSVRGHGAYAEPGQVNRRYAVWAGCPDNLCSVYRYDIRTGDVVRVPGDYKHTQYRSAVSANGDVYYGRSLYSCGSLVKLMRYRPGVPPIVLTTLPRGYEFRFMNADARRVLYDSGRCSGGGSDIYSVEAR